MLRGKTLWFLLLIALVLATACGKRGKPRKKDGGTAVAAASMPDVSGAEPLLLVSDSPYQIWQGEETKVQVVAFTPDLEPADGAKVYVGDKVVGTTDEDGTLVFALKPTGTQPMTVTKEIGGKLHAGRLRLTAYSRTSSFESANLFVYTDRGVYRPAEDVLVRAFNWRLRGEFSPIDEARVEVSLRDPRDRVVTGSAMTTDAFGVAATSLRVPEDAAEGLYQLVVRYEGAEETARLRIKRFRPPAIDIQHDLPRYVAPKTEDLAVTVKLKYFTGGTPEAGQFVARAMYRDKKLAEVKKPIRKDQPVSFTLPLAPIRKAVRSGDRFEVKLEAADRFGRRDEVIRDILYTKSPYVVVPDLDKDTYAEGEQVTLTVRLTDPDGIPVRGKELTLEGDGGKIKMAVNTDDGGVAVFQFTMPDHAFTVQVRAADVPTPLVSRSIPYPTKKPLRAELEDPVVRERKQTPVTVTFDPGFVPVERVVHLDLTDYSGAVAGGFSIPIHKTGDTYRAAGSFPAPGWGSMLITFYVAGTTKEQAREKRSPQTVGLITEGLSLTAHPDKELRIHLDGVPDQAAPRTELTARFRVLDPQEKPANAILGVALVDRAVLSLMDPLEKTPMDRFYNPRNKVLSTTGSDILTWPVVSRNWGGRVYDIALPPFGYLPGGPVQRPRRRDTGGGGFAGLAKPSSAPPGAKAAEGAEYFEGGEYEEGAEYDDESEPMEEKVAGDGLLAVLGAKGRGGGKARPEPKVRIVVRTELPATSLWRPRLLAPGGRAELSVRLPEALTEQELIAVASDKQGGIGLARKSIRVTQPVFVRSDLPRTLTAGDRIEAGVYVQNTTAEALTGTATLSGEVMEISPGSRKIVVPARGAAVARFNVSAGVPGKASFQVEFRAGDLGDAERRELVVRPRGAPELDEIAGKLEAGKLFTATIQRAKNEYIEAHVEVAFPTLIPALQEIDALLDHSAWWADGHLATPQAVAALERYLARHLPDHDKRAALRGYLKQVAGALPATMNPDGGTFWWRSGAKSNPFATAWALRLMAALRSADIAVDEGLIIRAVAYLKRACGKDGLWNTSAVAFWEGDSRKVRLQISAGIFRSLAEAARVAKLEEHRAWIEELSGTYRAYLDGDPDDPLTAAEAALGLWALAHKPKQALPDTERERLLLAAKKLEAMRKQEHWEPSWFHAYGGTIEATVASLELFARLDPQAFSDSLRAGLMYLLSTRKEWGGWHCPFGTTEAIRAFTLLPPPGKEIASTVSVRLRDAEIARVEIDPEDPYLSALRLRHLAFGTLLQPGKNQIAVHYNGALSVPVRVLVHRYTPKVASGPGLLKLERRLAKKRLRQGERAEVTLRIDARKEPGSVRVVVPLPANARALPDSLDKLRKEAGVLALQQARDELRLLIQGGADRRVAFQLEGARVGAAALDPARARSTLRPAVAAVSTADTLTVRP